MAFPGSKLSLTVELALGADLTASPSDWVWTNVTSYVRITSGTVVQITRGGYDGAIQAPPSTCNFTADNRDGRWVPTNPTGAWYGQIGLNTPVRVKTAESSTSVRWTGFLSALPPRWDPSESDRFVTVTAAGVLRRMERGSAPLRTPLVRAMSGTTPAPVGYWPCEDGSAALSLAEFSGGPAMTFNTGLTPNSDGPDGSAPLPEFTSSATVNASVPTHPNTNEWEIACVFNFPAVPASATTLLKWNTTGTYPVWQIVLTPGSPDTLTLEAYDSGGTIQISNSMNFAVSAGGAEPYGQWLLLFAQAEQDGADVNHAISVYAATSGTGSSGIETSVTAGRITKLTVPASANTDGMGAGHYTVWNADLGAAFPVEPSAISGFDGDEVYTRIHRLSLRSAGADGAVALFGTDLDNLMGPQTQNTKLEVYREAEAVNGGRLIEVRDAVFYDAFLGMVFSDEISNQAAALTLNHDSRHLNPPFDPVDDDQHVRNDWTATRSGGGGTGSSARVVADSGRLTPEIVGTYDDATSVNIQTDAELIHQAGWRVNIGTVEGLRFPVLTLNLARNPSLISAWIACDLGSRITITNPPAGIAPDDIDLLIEGYTETLGPYEWSVQLNCSPYKPWHVFVIADTTAYDHDFLGRLAASDACALRADITSGASSMQVDPNGDWWTEVADDFDPDINVRVGGEVVSVSAIATTAATFVAAGTADHDDNASLTPGLPAGATAGDLLLIFAAIRSSGTGTVNTPTGYTRLPVFNATDNAQLFGKIHSGSESTPTVSFTGGAAGDTTSAQMAAFRNVPQSLTDLADIVVDSSNQLNASAQDIAFGTIYPYLRHRCIILALGWKQDDWTSVADATGYTAEIGEPDSITGNDQGLVWDYAIQTTAAAISAGSFVVTGGASAISRSAVCALAGGYQTFTISARSLNGVTKAHSAGARVEVEDPGVMGL